MSTLVSSNLTSGGGEPNGEASPQVPALRTAGIHDDLGPVLARIPDLDLNAVAKPNEKLTDGRIIGQTLSMKMIFGMAAALVLGAILPFLFGRGSARKPVQELPAFDLRSSESSTSTDQTLAPKWQPAAPAPETAQQNSVAASPDATAAIAPPPPPLGSYRPAAMGPPAWARPQTSAAPPFAPQPAGDNGYVSAANRPDLQADRRGDPAALYSNPPGAEYRGTPSDPAARRDGPAYGVSDDYRYRNLPAAPAARQDNPTLPSGGNGVGGDSRYQQYNDPGTARFEGTITAPPGRTY
jgi:hypothetical protein